MIPKDPFSEWERIVQGLEAKSVTLAGIYAHARLISWDAKGIELGFPAQSLQATLGGDSENFAKLRAFICERLGTRIEVRFKAMSAEASPSLGSVAQIENERARSERERRMEEARSHPATKAVIEAFGADIEEIKVNG